MIPSSTSAQPADRCTYLINVAVDNLDFKRIEIADPVPLGRQILAAAGVEVPGDYSLFAILPSGDFEDIRLDEPFDLRGRGIEKFVVFQTDRVFKFTLNDRQISWGKPAISGADLYKLTAADKDQTVFLEVRGGQDRLVEPTEIIDLTAPGIERFITAPRPPLEIIVNSRPKVVVDPCVTFEQVVQFAFPDSNTPNTCFSVTYRKADSKPSEGEFGVGGKIKVKQGTIFNVTRTDKS